MSEKKQCSSSSCDKKSCEGCSSAKKNTIPKEELNAYSVIKKVVGVVSGKGGVGKSFVTAPLFIIYFRILPQLTRNCLVHRTKNSWYQINFF